jgi:carboxyl-terminal processing protease
MRLTTARYYTPSGRSIQALGVSPDIIVAQPPRVAETEEPEGSIANRTRSEADLRGRLDNDSLTEEERRLIEEERARAEASAERRKEDYQLAYAIDIAGPIAGCSQVAVLPVSALTKTKVAPDAPAAWCS